MDQDPVGAYCEALRSFGIDCEALEHPYSVEIAGVLKALDMDFADCSPALVMRGDGEFLVVVIRGDTRADFKKIKRGLGLHDLRMASKDEVEELTSLPVGAARVYLPDVRTYVDEKVFEREYLTGGSGRFDCSIRVRTSDLTKLPDVVIMDLSKAS
jgi:prolyl-tRNA editing enzyme YbaK/EbsC (Cys-tRNA(Pro) deacylase)